MMLSLNKHQHAWLNYLDGKLRFKQRQIQNEQRTYSSHLEKNQNQKQQKRHDISKRKMKETSSNIYEANAIANLSKKKKY